MEPLINRTYITGVVLAGLVLLLSVAPAFGDSYAVSVIASSQSESFYGIDAKGDFVVNLAPSDGCGGAMGTSNCFATYYMGQQSPVFSLTAPILAWDNGSACSQSAGGDVLSGMCNSGHELLAGFLGETRGVWSGTDPLTDLLSNGTFDGGFLNSIGDGVFIDGLHNTLVSVVDLSGVPARGFAARSFLPSAPAPVPEPESLVLVGSGLLAAVGAIRRRLVG